MRNEQGKVLGIWTIQKHIYARNWWKTQVLLGNHCHAKVVVLKVSERWVWYVWCWADLRKYLGSISTLSASICILSVFAPRQKRMIYGFPKFANKTKKVKESKRKHFLLPPSVNRFRTDGYILYFKLWIILSFRFIPFPFPLSFFSSHSLSICPALES